jgi:hypothetical protein
MSKKFWTEERIKIVKEVYSLPHVTEHIVAVKELRKRGIIVTMAAIQAMSNKKEYGISRPYIIKGTPSRGKRLT